VAWRLVHSHVGGQRSCVVEIAENGSTERQFPRSNLRHIQSPTFLCRLIHSVARHTQCVQLAGGSFARADHCTFPLDAYSIRRLHLRLEANSRSSSHRHCSPVEHPTALHMNFYISLHICSTCPSSTGYSAKKDQIRQSSFAAFKGTCTRLSS
jgi:hypothetical protein